MFRPVNRYILIEMPPKPKNSDSLIVLPEDYQPAESSHLEVNIISAASDVRFNTKKATKLLVDASMVEEIKIGGTIYNVILDNYVIGIIE